jgi:hypothetical protein
MKTLIILSLFLLNVNILLAQNYESIFGSDSTQWNISMGNLWGMRTDQHKVVGDTTINGLSYKIVDGYNTNGFQGYLREDSVQGKAWYKNNQDTTEFLIMDLELNVGDSMFIGGNWNANPGYYLVDSVYISNNRKHVRFDFTLYFMNTLSNGKFTLIEGITSNLGFRYQDNDYINNFNPELLCSYKNGTQEFGTNQCVQLNLREINKEEQVSVYPNPFSSRVTIDVSSLKGEINQFDLVNSIGQTIKTEAVNNSKLVIDNLDHHQAGTYFLIFRDVSGSSIGSKTLIKITDTK